MATINKIKLKMEPHLFEPAIVLRYVETVPNEEQLKIIQLNGLNERSDSSAIAHFIFDQCQPLIPANYLNDLRNLVIFLQNRQNSADSASLNLSGNFLPKEEEPDFTKLDEYIELLYDEGQSKQSGVSLISKLFMNLSLEELAEIVKNERLLSILQRTFKEDSKRNFEVAIQLCQLFHRLSEFVPLHSILTYWKIGMLTLQLAEYELKRWELWQKQMGELTDENAKNKWKIGIRKQDQLITVCLQILLNLANDIQIEAKMVQKGIMLLLFKALEHDSPKLLLVSIKFLWKLGQIAENQQFITKTEGTIEKLIAFTSPSNKQNSLEDFNGSEICVPLFSLLFNCSFDPLNCRRMVQAGLVSLLAPHILDCDISLPLMYQLSIMDDAKAMFAYTDSISTLFELLFHRSNFKSDQSEKHIEKQETLIKGLLFNIVLEKRNAQLLCGTDGKQLDSLMAYAFDGECGDLLGIKIARNIVAHEGPTREMFRKWIPQLLENAIEKINLSGNFSKTHIFGLECLAICAQITEAFWMELDSRHRIVDFLMNLLKEAEKLPTPIAVENGQKRGKKISKTISDDVLLQVIIFCGTLAKHNFKMAESVEKKLLSLIITTLNKCQNDDEIVIQCCYVFVCLLSHGGELTNRLCEPEGRIVKILLNLMHDKNPRIRSLADKALEYISEISVYWKNKIMKAKFQWHNAQWLEMVENDPIFSISNDEPIEFNNAIVPAEFVLNFID